MPSLFSETCCWKTKPFIHDADRATGSCLEKSIDPKIVLKMVSDVQLKVRQGLHCKSLKIFSDDGRSSGPEEEPVALSFSLKLGMNRVVT